MIVNLKEILENDVLEIRGDGKAGSGLVLVLQSLAGLLNQNESIHVQEWPFFGSARKGAAVRSYLRASHREIRMANEITTPHVSILMDEGAAKFVDFAAGVKPGGTFILNTHHTPEEAAKHYKLSGRVMTVAGDHLGEKFLKKPMGNISVYAVLVKAIGLDTNRAAKALQENLKKRRLPEPIVSANMELFNESVNAVQEGVFSERGEHQTDAFSGYGEVPMGAQYRLRVSRGNKTSSYARAGARVVFEDPDQSCTGCTSCVTACPENIITFVPHEKKGILVTGADFANYCKTCNECIETCPENLFKEQPYQEPWEESL